MTYIVKTKTYKEKVVQLPKQENKESTITLKETQTHNRASLTVSNRKNSPNSVNRPTSYHKNKTGKHSNADWIRYRKNVLSALDNNFISNDTNTYLATLMIKDKRIHTIDMAKKLFNHWVKDSGLDKYIGDIEYNYNKHPHIHVVVKFKNGFITQDELKNLWPYGYSDWKKAPKNFNHIANYLIKTYSSNAEAQGNFDQEKAKKLYDSLELNKRNIKILLNGKKNAKRNQNLSKLKTINKQLAELYKEKSKIKGLYKQENQKLVKKTEYPILRSRGLKQSITVTNPTSFELHLVGILYQYASTNVTKIVDVDPKTGEIIGNSVVIKKMTFLAK